MWGMETLRISKKTKKNEINTNMQAPNDPLICPSTLVPSN